MKELMKRNKQDSASLLSFKTMTSDNQTQKLTLPGASSHYQHHNEVPIKDGIQYDFTSSVPPSRDISSGSLVSTSVVVQNETINGSVTSKSVSRPSGLAKPNNFTSIHRNDSSTRTLSNTVADTKRILNKDPHLHPKFQAATLPSSSHQMGRFSSSANPRPHDFPHTNNYRPNGSVPGANAGHILTYKFRSRESEMPKELTRGPRCNYNNFAAQSSVVNKDEYVKFLVQDYRKVNDDPIVELMNLRQQGSVIEYHEDFKAIITRLELSEEYTLNYFLDGLRQDIQLLVRVFQPQTMMKAFTLAKLYDAANTQSCSVVLPNKFSKSSYTNNKLILTMKPNSRLQWGRWTRKNSRYSIFDQE